ncbi:MAG: hypothetical protein AAB658_00285 [Chloroflexota bacterium]
MKRKTYEMNREAKIDQAIGFIVFPLVNAPLFAAIYWMLSLPKPTNQATPYDLLIIFGLLAPWVFNGIGLLLSIIYRPHIAVGGLAFIFAVISGVVIAGILFLPACFLAVAVGILFAQMEERAGAIVGIVTLFAIMLVAVVLPGLIIVLIWVRS